MRTAERWVAGLALAYALFLVYGSLVPLHWTPLPLAQAWQDFMAAPGPRWREDERVDVAVNFLLTVPLSFALAHLATALPTLAGRAWGWVLVWPACAALSLGVEFAQSFFPPRDPSWTDLCAQGAGALAGMVLYLAAGRHLRHWLDGLALHHSAAARSRRWLAGYLLLLLAFSLMPLDLSLSPVELYRKWRAGRVVLWPFGAAWPGTWPFVYGLCTDIALWVPVGLLWRTDAAGHSLRAVIGKGLLAAALVELVQLPVLSRVSDVTDVLLAGVGVALGAALLPWLRGWRGRAAARQTRALAVAWVLWLGVALALLWAPFDFSAQWGSLDRAARVVTRMPFETYFFRGEFQALNEILRKVLVFLPGGLLGGAWAWRVAGGRPSPLGLVGLWLLACVLEAGQLWLPAKTADLTDAALACLGAWVGWRLAGSLLGQAPAGMPETPPRPGAGDAEALPPLWTARPAGRLPGLWLPALTVFALALLIWVAGRAPGLPYNLAKLVPAGPAGVVAALGLAAVLWWMLAAPMWLLDARRAGWRAAFLLPLLAHGLVSFAVLRASVPLAMIHKIVGDPVLAWGGPWEDLGRYLALHACVMLPLYGAALLVRAVRQPAAVLDLLYWVCAAVLLLWPLHWVVVEQAGTDNLVELMRGGGSLQASLALGVGALALATCGSALGALAAPGRRGVMLVLAGLALAAAWGAFPLGLEPLLVKYGRAFSALQFIVSAGRDSYAVGSELALRATLALLLPALAVAVLQAPAWRRLSAPAA